MDARRRGIETVFEDLAGAPGLDIASNQYLRRELRRPGPLDPFCACSTGQMQLEAARYMSDLKIGIGATTQAVETLSGGQRQRVAVARAGACADSAIVDEPTAAQGVKESGMMLKLIRRIKARGLSLS